MFARASGIFSCFCFSTAAAAASAAAAACFCCEQGFRKNGNVAKNENRRFFGESKPVLYELQEKSWQSCRAVQQLSNELLLKLDVLGIAAVASILGNSDRASVYRFLCPPEGTRWSTTVLTSSSHGAGQGVSQDHFGSLIFQMVQELRLGSQFWLRSHFSENLVIWATTAHRDVLHGVQSQGTSFTSRHSCEKHYIVMSISCGRRQW